MATVLTEERRIALGSMITQWFGDQDDDGRLRAVFDYPNSNEIDLLIDEAIAPAIADAVQCALAAQAKEPLNAAASDLLEALKGVVAVADRATDEFDKARAAIAKATGAA